LANHSEVWSGYLSGILAIATEVDYRFCTNASFYAFN